MTLTRRTFLMMAGPAALAATASKRRPVSHRARPRAEELVLYVGTYTTGDSTSEGIYVCRFTADTGALEVGQAVGGIANPSFLALDPQQRTLYAVSETAEYEGAPGGGVYAYRRDPGTGMLTMLNAQPSKGAAPCHLTVDATGRYVLVANYTGGNVAVLPIQEGGRLGAPAQVVQHEGSSVNENRQEGPHAHSVTLDAANRFAFVADLGIDKVMVYRFDAGQGTLAAAAQPWAAVKAGAGPRHFAFHPDGRRAYVINELDGTLTAFAYDPEQGTLTETQTLSTLPAGFTGENYCADVHVSASGRYVYGSNRGHDSIVVFTVDEATGALAPVQHQSTLGNWPRNFALDPTGRFLLAANQRSDTVVVFAIDPDTGKLTPTGHTAAVPSPVCLRFVAPVS